MCPIPRKNKKIPLVIFYDPISWFLIDYVWLLGLVIVPTGFGHTLESFLLRKIKAYVIATVALLEPLIASSIAVVLFNEIPPNYVIFGGIIVSLGIMLTIIGERDQYNTPQDNDFIQ